MKAWRIAFSVAGILMLLYGAVSLLVSVPFGNLLLLALWLIGAVLIHDGVIAPAVVGVGWFLHRTVPERARRYLQAGLIAAGLITAVAIPMILQQGAEPATKALLRQNFGGNLTILLGVVAAASLLLYAASAVRRTRPSPRHGSEPPTAPTAGPSTTG